MDRIVTLGSIVLTAHYATVVVAKANMRSVCCFLNRAHRADNTTYERRLGAYAGKEHLAMIVRVADVGFESHSSDNTADKRHSLDGRDNLTIVVAAYDIHLCIRHADNSCHAHLTHAKRIHLSEVIAAHNIAIAVAHDTSHVEFAGHLLRGTLRLGTHLATVYTHLYRCTHRLTGYTTDKVVLKVAHKRDFSSIFATDVGCRFEIFAAATGDTANANTGLLRGGCYHRRSCNISRIFAVDYYIAVNSAKTTYKGKRLACNTRTICNRAVVAAVTQRSRVDIHDKTANELLGRTGQFHRAGAIDAKIAHLAPELQLVDKSIRRLPILQGVALTVEYTIERQNHGQFLCLLHVDITFEANHTLVILPLGKARATIHSLGKGD